MYCSRCGAEQPESARFCERCGHRHEVDEPTPARRRGGPDRRWIGAGVAVALLVAVGAVLLATGTVGGGDGDDTAAAPTSTPRTVATTVPAATTTQAPRPSPEAEIERAPARPARARVSRTCGRNGIGGDCHLSVRAQPSASAAEVRRLDEGDTLTLTCQVRGDRVYSSALGASSTVWSKTRSGGYVSNAYLAGSRVRPDRITLERC